jgi:hypothetical protein
VDSDIVARGEPRTHGRSGEIESQIAILDRNVAVSLGDGLGERQRHASERSDRRLRGHRKLQAALEGVALEEIEESFVGLVLDVDRMKMIVDPDRADTEAEEDQVATDCRVLALARPVARAEMQISLPPGTWLRA